MLMWKLCEYVYVVLEKINAIKVGFGYGGVVFMDVED